MSRFFYKTKGAISVFLLLVLLPVLLFGGLTTDAARIYFSRVVISDAGEMTMNAALAQYNASLLDEYGLLVMDKDPATYEEKLKEFFNQNLNGAGIQRTNILGLPTEEEYAQLLDLVADDVEAFAVRGSEIYRTEAEKQQIVEYMKYRAPLCLVDTILNKLDELKDTKKKTDAVMAEMEFSKAMKKCQDAIEEAYQALKILEEENDTFFDFYHDRTNTPEIYIQNVLLADAELYYKRDLVRAHLMLAAISKYDGAATGNVEEMAKSFIAASKQVNMSATDPTDYFSQYLNCLFYQNGVATAGGINKVVTEWKGANPEPQEKETVTQSDGTTKEEETEAHAKWRDELGKKEKVVADYKAAQNAISGYVNLIRSYALNIIKTYSGAISSCYNRAASVNSFSLDALEKLEAIKPLIEVAQNKWQNWSDKEQDAFGTDENSREYENFFKEEDASNYEDLIRKVKAIQSFYGPLCLKLEKISFCEKYLAKDEFNTQYQAQRQKADKILESVEIRLDFQYGDYSAVFQEAYNSVNLAIEPDMVHAWSKYSDDPNNPFYDPFYKKLKEWQPNEEEVDQEKKKEANETLSKSAEAGEAAQNTDNFPKFDWNSVSASDLPSKVLAAAVQEPDASMTGVGGSVDEDKCEESLNGFMDSINAASSFLDGLDRILGNALVDLYVAEYTMQMFSYYTVDKNIDGSTKSADEIIALSGYKMNEDSHKAYKAEAEYVLWGKSKSQENVQAVVMTLFGIRLLFNSFFAFTDAELRAEAQGIAHLVCGPAQFLVPIVQVLIQLGYATIETANDITLLTQGYGVVILKDKKTWSTGLIYSPLNGATKACTKKENGFTLNYAEYMRIFLVLKMLAGGEKDALARIADCIQVNHDYNLINGSTMVSIRAKVKSRTTFMRKISEMEGGPGLWSYADDCYYINYQSVLGY